jgi:hypothetical protein
MSAMWFPRHISGIVVHFLAADPKFMNAGEEVCAGDVHFGCRDL